MRRTPAAAESIFGVMARGPIAYQPPPGDSGGNYGVGVDFAKDERGYVVKSVEESEEELDVKVG